MENTWDEIMANKDALMQRGMRDHYFQGLIFALKITLEVSLLETTAIISARHTVPVK